jgi:hypothetical protein
MRWLVAGANAVYADVIEVRQLQAVSRYCTDKGAASWNDSVFREERVWVGRVGTKQRWLDSGDVGRRLRGKERLAPPRRLSCFSRAYMKLVAMGRREITAPVLGLCK